MRFCPTWYAFRPCSPASSEPRTGTEIGNARIVSASRQPNRRYRRIQHEPPVGGSRAPPGNRGWLLAILVCAAFFAASAPTLYRLDFFDGVEHINLATVLELRRDGQPRQWLMPELEREPRTVKPPLTAWIAAIPVHSDSVTGMGSPDPSNAIGSLQPIRLGMPLANPALHLPAPAGGLRTGQNRRRPGAAMAIGRSASLA